MTVSCVSCLDVQRAVVRRGAKALGVDAAILGVRFFPLAAHVLWAAFTNPTSGRPRNALQIPTDDIVACPIHFHIGVLCCYVHSAVALNKHNCLLVTVHDDLTQSTPHLEHCCLLQALLSCMCRAAGQHNAGHGARKLPGHAIGALVQGC